MASLLRSEVNWTASRSRSRSVPKSSAPAQPRPPRVRARSSQPRRPGQSVQPGPWPQPAPARPLSQSCSPEWNRAPAASPSRRARPRHRRAGLPRGAAGPARAPAGRPRARRLLARFRPLACLGLLGPRRARQPTSRASLPRACRPAQGPRPWPAWPARGLRPGPAWPDRAGRRRRPCPAGGIRGRPGQLLAEAAHGLPDVFPDLADDVADRRGQFLFKLVELVAPAAQFLTAGLGYPVDLTAVYLVVRDQALFLEPGQPGVDRAGGGRVHAHEPVAQQPDDLVAVPGLLVEEPEQVQPEAAMAEYRTQLASPSISFLLSGC